MLKRKDKILISAIELLAQEGIYGVTTKKLAHCQGVTEPALYRQYKSKKDIILHIIEEFSSYDRKIMNTILQSSFECKDAVMFYVKRFAELYQNYSELSTVMFSFDVYHYDEETDAMMKDILRKRLDFLQELIENSNMDLCKKNRYTPKGLASMVNGIIFAQTYEWQMADQSFSLEERLITFVEKLLACKSE